jgi:ketosteroid isomerase-like protein
MRHKTIALLFILAFFFSCKEKMKEENNTDNSKADIVAADKAFSKMSEEKGTQAAFLEYIDSTGVLLRPNSLPLVGADAVDYISQDNDTSYTMTWQPMGASISTSGDLGYTYGTYLLKFKNKDSVVKGTYISVWRKQYDGKWKFVVDAGNEGLGQP